MCTDDFELLQMKIILYTNWKLHMNTIFHVNDQHT